MNQEKLEQIFGGLLIAWGGFAMYSNHVAVANMYDLIYRVIPFALGVYLLIPQAKLDSLVTLVSRVKSVFTGSAS